MYVHTVQDGTVGIHTGFAQGRVIYEVGERYATNPKSKAMGMYVDWLAAVE